jgi:hypothetical protein
VADAKNPAMNGDEAAVREPCADLRLRDPGRKQLVAGDDTVRIRRQDSQFPADRGALWSHIDH